MATEPPETMQDRNRRVALEVNAMTGTTDIDHYLAYFNDDPSWHINRRTLQGRDALVALCDTVRKVFPNGLDRAVRCTLADGDRVAIQHVNRAVTGRGQDYVNEYMKLFEFDPDGRIRAVWEYLDSRYAAEMLAPGT